MCNYNWHAHHIYGLRERGEREKERRREGEEAERGRGKERGRERLEENYCWIEKLN